MNSPSNEHTEISLLIPWYANGSLRDEQRQAVDRHLQTCGECQLELATMQQLQARWQATPALPAAAGDFARLMAAIDAAESTAAPRVAPAGTPRRNPQPDWITQCRSWLNSWIDRLAAARSFPAGGLVLASVAGALVVVNLVREAGQSPEEVNRFQTLATAGSMAAVGERDIQIVFAPGTAPAQINALVDALKAHILAGPTPMGAVTVRLDASGKTAGDVAVIAEQLRSNPLVILAEPALPPTSGPAPTVH
jgi:hypothetical protein